ncbi:hypothetical protein [Zobellia sp. B3R18]|uniref:hypothetical protein n=1 Tax=Zobellia sp. B3R18 TaxID=2841568 RepID=UPI001C07EEBA|nr:hypothetical protein [Zobellia sp. B3R18]MBU2973949.1 hypothetical protein [Zobellia sp. B3R18]
MQKFLKHITFLLSATNEHGVHSPFVYSYVTKCLYGKKKFSRLKSINVLCKSIAYFKTERIMFLDDSDKVEEIVQSHFQHIEKSSTNTNMVYFSKTNLNKVINLLAEKKITHNKTMFFLDGIYESDECEAIWKAVKNHKNVTVTVDMFYCGAVFFRKEQAKEHFKIRI